MPISIYIIRLDDHLRRMMAEMKDVNWQAEIREAVEKMVREKKATLPGRGSPVEDEDVAYREQRRRDDQRG